jgi:protein-L-isoaspartate(D-aspartate) O-methyltransferase
MNLPTEERFATLRLRMVETQLRAREVADERVLAAMARVPRHEFVPPQHRDQAYGDYPLPIGEDQTISQPYIVALMLQALALTPADRVLEVGTGSGYVAALLAELAAQVVSVERFASLADRAAETLRRLGYTNLEIVHGDGSQGFPAKAPFDAIVVSAAAPVVPPALLTQLAEAGRMVIPIGPADSQQLQLIHMRNHEPRIQLRELCRFVPLVSGHGA